MRSDRNFVSSAALILLLAACQTTGGSEYEPLRPPVLSPPGDAPLQQRIDYWESRLSALPPEDLSEAHLRLGDLYLEDGESLQARLEFRQALNGPLGQREVGLAERGLAMSWLLEGERSAAESHLIRSLPFLEGAELAEAEVLLDHARGRLQPGSVDPVLVARLEPYLGDGARTMASATEDAAAGSVFHDVGRSVWRARPARAGLEAMTRPYRITVHHTSEPFHSMEMGASRNEVRNHQAYHQNARGWSDIGYHFLIDRAGRVFEGRPLEYQGAHAGRTSDGTANHNIGNFGVCLLGNFVSQPDRGPDYAIAQSPTDEQLASLGDLVDSLRERYSIKRRNVFGHSHFRGTQCPGPQLLRWTENYRSGPSIP